MESDEPQVTQPAQVSKYGIKFLLAVRGIVAGVVVLISAAILSHIAHWDFNSTIIFLSILVIIEWIVKAWQMKKHSQKW